MSSNTRTHSSALPMTAAAVRGLLGPVGGAAASKAAAGDSVVLEVGR
ncbi:hypothetical protein ACQP00_49580 [Dactylosporangium sp. CS-047395]